MSLEDLYREVILDHYRSPRNKGKLDHATVIVELNNPVCGDEIVLYLDLADGVVHDIRFDGQGCSISQSSASMMTQAVKGKPLDVAADFVERFKGMMRSELTADEVNLGDIEALQGVAKFPQRIKCAVLSWEALRQGLEKGEGEVSGTIG